MFITIKITCIFVEADHSIRNAQGMYNVLHTVYRLCDIDNPIITIIINFMHEINFTKTLL